MPTAHAKLSASGSARWLNCPGSVKAEQEHPQRQGSRFAEEGTAAHELGELCLIHARDAASYVGQTLPESKWKVDVEMADHVQTYVDYVRALGGEQMYEVRVDFSDWVPEGFGTSDGIVISNDGTLHVVDLKYGKGIRVDADENSQGMLYALGAIAEYGMIYTFDRVQIHIVQPRLDHISTWQTTAARLLAWGEWVSQQAELALTDDAPRNPGDKQCQWCGAKATCKALSAHVESVLMLDFDDLDAPNIDTLSDEQIGKALAAKRLIQGWLDAIEAHAIDNLTSGKGFAGFKLVAGRSVRQWGDNAAAEREIGELLGEQAYTRKLISPAQAEKILGATKRKGIAHLVVKPDGKPTIAPETDPRPAINAEISDFECLQGE